MLSLVAFTHCFAAARGVQAQQSASPVVVTRVVEASIHSAHRVVGTVNPLRTSTIGSAVDGRVVQFMVNQGQSVKKGQPLAQLRTDTLTIEKLAAQAELELYRQRLAELENGSRPEEVSEAESRLLGAKAAMANALRKLRRMESLSQTRAASDSELEDAGERAEFTQHAFAAAKAVFKRIEQGPRIEEIAQATAQTELQHYRVKLIEDRIKKHTVQAPFDGFVSQEFTEVGAWVSQGDPIVQIVQLDEVEVQAPTTAEYAVQLSRGDEIRLEFPELPEKLFTGKLDRVVPVAESRARTFPVYINLTNEIRADGPLLMAGMLARVHLPVGQTKNSLLVPKDALVLNQNERAVFVVDTNSSANQVHESLAGTVRKVIVELGVASGELIQVHGQLKTDDLVVIIGNERLVDGAKVEIIRTLDDQTVTLGSVR